jgi:hypothetical protein
MDQAERSGRAAEVDLDEAEKAIRALEVDHAASSLTSARKRLSDPYMAKYPEHDMLKRRLDRDDEQLVAARAEVKKRELERAVAAQKQTLDVSFAHVSEALEALHRDTAARAEIEAAHDALKDAKEKLDAGSELEKQDAKLADLQAGLKKKLDAANADMKKTEKAIAFRDGPIVLRQEGALLADRAKAESDVEKKRALLAGAAEKYRSCAENGAQLVAGTPELATTKLAVDGRSVAAKSIAADCGKKADALAKAAKKQVPPPRKAAKKKKS